MFVKNKYYVLIYKFDINKFLFINLWKQNMVVEWFSIIYRLKYFDSSSDFTHMLQLANELQKVWFKRKNTCKRLNIKKNSIKL